MYLERIYVLIPVLSGYCQGCLMNAVAPPRRRFYLGQSLIIIILLLPSTSYKNSEAQILKFHKLQTYCQKFTNYTIFLKEI